MNKKLWLNESMLQMNKKFDNTVLNIMNAPAGSGKSTFIFKEFLNDTTKYVNGLKKKYIDNLDRILYVCDTTMLKSSILQDTKGITKILEKNDLKQAMKTKSLQSILEGDIGYIKVITYSTLGFLLNNKPSRTILLNYYDCIIMDEIHNLIKYSFKFDTDTNKLYGIILEWLPTMLDKDDLLILALTATPYNIYYPLKKLNIMYRTIFNEHELKRIIQYKNETHFKCKYAVNYIKTIGINYDWIKHKDYKILIYTNTKLTSENYKKLLIDYGYNVEWLCSVNNKTDGKPTMNDKQLELRKHLLSTGMFPNDLDILIINGAYETGWNLYDNKVQWVLIDSTAYDIQIQARNRVRHDIKALITKEVSDSDGFIIEYDQFKNEYKTNESIGTIILAKFIEDKYINIKLTKTDKDYLVNKYAIIWSDKHKATWKTFKHDLECANYKVITNNKGTFILNKDDDFKTIMKENKKKMNNNEELYNYLSNLETIPLNKEEQNKLINKINVRVDGHLQKSYKKLNIGLEMLNLPFKIDSKRLTINKQKDTYWIVEKTK
ncbi:DEAD/DEAH box helicase family protein [Clostridium botulinum]|uniref:DEAD/DEAH box helicase family protein n=1 Tax=Clostridium botulinum TaxID=1491 RepID=UPI001C9B177D|nr:DEAD/DEAH box helicase family protein [Clostridium botulinum]MBY6838796.1 DEAD/DEAH box helicase family protein [Clostridium botulinum]